MPAYRFCYPRIADPTLSARVAAACLRADVLQSRRQGGDAGREHMAHPDHHGLSPIRSGCPPVAHAPARPRRPRTRPTPPAATASISAGATSKLSSPKRPTRRPTARTAAPVAAARSAMIQSSTSSATRPNGASTGPRNGADWPSAPTRPPKATSPAFIYTEPSRGFEAFNPPEDPKSVQALARIDRRVSHARSRANGRDRAAFLEEALFKMEQHHIKRLPVIEDHRLAHYQRSRSRQGVARQQACRVRAPRLRARLTDRPASAAGGAGDRFRPNLSPAGAWP